MKTIEIWPKAIEGGDAIIDDKGYAYLKLTDPESDQEVIVFLGAEAENQVVETLKAWAASRTSGGPTN